MSSSSKVGGGGAKAPLLRRPCDVLQTDLFPLPVHSQLFVGSEI